MTVYIVLKNDQVDEVFLDRAAAEAHQANLVKRWNITKIIEKTVNSLC
jgi:hypothetical protein